MLKQAEVELALANLVSESSYSLMGEILIIPAKIALEAVAKSLGHKG